MSYRAFVRMATGQDIRGSLDDYKRKNCFLSEAELLQVINIH